MRLKNFSELLSPTVQTGGAGNYQSMMLGMAVDGMNPTTVDLTRRGKDVISVVTWKKLPL